MMFGDGGYDGAQCFVDLLGGRENFCHIGIEHHHQRAVLHPAGKAVGFGFFVVKPVFGGYLFHFLTGFGCGRFFHSL